jgi:hypothetical protein
MHYAKLTNISATPPIPIDVQFNPTEYGIDSGASYAELQVPGLSTPLLQFVRGEVSTLSLELFLDGTDTRQNVQNAIASPSQGSLSSRATTVEDRLTQIRAFVTIQRELHAPPVCNFSWNNISFDGVVTSLRERYTLFDASGNVLRARVTLTLKSYASVEKQLADIARRSPDHTRVRVPRLGETLAQIADEAYGDPRMWKSIATANNIERPRFLTPGVALHIPAL